MDGNKYLVALAGGLTLMLVSTACASKSNPRTTANQPIRDSAVASDRTVYSDRDQIASNRTRTGDDRIASTERSVPSDRTGLGDSRMAGDQVVPCANDSGDMTPAPNCTPSNRRASGDRTAHDSTTGVIASCPHRTDSSGHVIYDDPACAARYRQQSGSSYENVTWTQENAFYDRYVTKAVKHAREAEIAGNQGHTPEMLRHAELSLDQAKEAQRAGTNIELNEGIMALRETLRHGVNAQWQDSIGHVRDARIKLSRAGGMNPRDTRPLGAQTASTRMDGRARTVQGELVGDDMSARPDGRQRYILRSRDGQDVPVVLTPDMSNKVKAGDMVEAQVASDGSVTAINKY